MHSGIELWEKSRRTATLNAVQDAFHETWEALIALALERQPNLDAWMTGGRKKASKDIEDRYILGKEQIATYIEYAKVDPLRVWDLPDTGEPASEVRIEADFGGINVLGIVDLIMVNPETGALLVRDIKTGTKLPVGTRQLVTYRWMINKKYGVDPQYGDYWMAKNGVPTPRSYLGNFTEAQVSAWYQMMDYAEKQGIYIPNPGDHCRICDVARFCPDMGGTPPEGIPLLGT